MARIINDTPRGSWQQDCPGCFRLIEFSPMDIHEGRDEDDGTRYKYVSCPSCKRTINLLLKSSNYEDDTYI